MRFLLRTLSVSYLRQHLAKTLLTLLGVVVGVATFTAIRSARATLVDGLRHTVDHMAGKAQIQVASEAGVPEQMLERLRDLEGVRAQAPVIEQIVVPERGELGSLLVLGVDLLGDREMREYGFDGEDADLDDPLLFLAQPDSIALSRSFAQRAGIARGDRFRFRAPHGMKEVVVRGLLEPKGFAEGFGGNIAVLDVYAAQELFGMGRRFDRIEIRLEPEVTIDAGLGDVRRAVGPGYEVETPSRRGAQLERLISNFTAGFTISSVFALGIGTFLIFNAFSVSVNRRRRDIGTLRALGATPRQVQALFLLEALWIGVAGGLLGWLAGSALTHGALAAMRDTVRTIYGVEDPALPGLEPARALEAALLGVLASLVGAWSPARQASGIRPTEALAKGAFQARVAGASLGRIGAGLITLAAATASAALVPEPGQATFFVVFGLGVLAALLLIGPLSRRLIERLAPGIARLSPVAGQLAADSLASNPRRTAGTVIAMTLSLAFVIGMASYINSTKHTLTRWMDDILTSDLYVRASAALVRPDFRFPPELRDELLTLPGVRAVESYRNLRVPYRGDEIQLLTIQIEPVMRRTRYEYLQGDRESMRRGLVEEGKCTISDNLHRRYGLDVGDTLDLSSPSGEVRIPIAAVVIDFSSDKGAAFLDRKTFLDLWHDDRVDIFDVSLQRGADPGAVREAIRARVGGRMPALVSTRAEFLGEIGKAIDSFYVLTRITLVLALGVAFLGIVTSLLISVVERQREIGILKALGALPAQIRRSIVFEALAMALVGLALAIPLGLLDARFMETTVAEAFAGWRMPHRFDVLTLLQLLIALPLVSVVAAWFPARSAAATRVTEAIVYE